MFSKICLFSLSVLLGTTLFAETSYRGEANSEIEWKEFVKKHNEYASGPTGYFAIQDMLVLLKGETAYLLEKKDKSKTSWTTDKQKKKKIVKIDYNGKEALLSGPEIETIDLLKSDDKKTDKKYEFKNGLIVRAYIYNDVKLKIWLYNPDSEKRKNFKELSFYPFDKKGIVTAKLERFKEPQGLSYIDSRKEKRNIYVVGKVNFELNQKPFELKVYSVETSWDKISSGSAFITDKTSDKTTYGGGRSLDFEIPSSTTTEVVLNFNNAHSFLCVFSNFYNCPIGITTLLDTEITYGEKLLAGAH